MWHRPFVSVAVAAGVAFGTVPAAGQRGASNHECASPPGVHNVQGRPHPELPNFEDQPATYPLMSLDSGVVTAIREDLRDGCAERALHHFFGSTRRPWFPAFVAYFPAGADTAFTAILHQRKEVGPGTELDALKNQDYIWTVVFSDTSFARPHTPADTVERVDTAVILRLIPTSRGRDHLLPAVLQLVSLGANPSDRDTQAEHDTAATMFPVGSAGGRTLYVAVVQARLERDVDYQISVTPRHLAPETARARAAYGWFRNESERSIEIGISTGAAFAGGRIEGFRPGVFALMHVNVLDFGGNVLASRWPKSFSLTVGGSVKGPEDRQFFEDVLFGVSAGHLLGSAGLTLGVARVSLSPESEGGSRRIRWGPFLGIDFRL